MAGVAAAPVRALSMEPGPAVATLAGVSQRYRRVVALDDVSLAIPAGRLVGLIGPDGVGKSTLLALVSGARRLQEGGLTVLGGDMRDRRHRRLAGPRIAYMPQGLGRNLYPDLSVRENVDFFARLFGQGRAEREARIAALLRGTGLAPFAGRLARQLSGGMKQKLGLCCALVHDPELLILDEPTTGVDPLSRRQFWTLVATMRARQPGMSVVVATAYMEEAEGFDWLVAMDGGRVVATGSAGELKRQTGAETLEEAFVRLLPDARRTHRRLEVPPRAADAAAPPAIVARGLTRRFGGFTAVDGISLEVGRGEIFGFLGSNGCGKTTTMKMLTGLLPANSGTAEVFGRTMLDGDRESRRRVGYMSQSFSLYGDITVRQNLELHARLFQLPAAPARARIAKLLGDFGLADHADARAAGLPLGLRQRLSLAVAVLHEPPMLILDEPTSGVDPVARDGFWELLIDLSRRQGVTIFISTHFMNEAARCDRIALMHAGRILATGTPAELVRARGAETLDAAFVAYLEAAAGPEAEAGTLDAGPSAPSPPARFPGLGRMLAYARREWLELWRDPVRLAFSLIGTGLLMLVFGYGITMDVEGLSFAALDRDHTPDSRAYIQEFSATRYFVERPPIADEAELLRRMRANDIQLAIEIPPGFGRDLHASRPTEISAWVDGAMPFRAETLRGYVQGIHQGALAALAAQTPQGSAPEVMTLETRFRYNQDFRSVYAMVPGVIALLLVFIPAILTALGVVREKELGSITNLYVTPTGRAEFLIGKQLPYIGLALFNALLLAMAAIWLFDVPLKGSAFALALGVLLYVTATTGFGLLISAFTATQVAALTGAAILTMMPAQQFSGMIVPVSALSGGAAVVSAIFPTTYFLTISVGTFTKALGPADLVRPLLALAAFIPVLTLLSVLLLPKQER